MRIHRCCVAVFLVLLSVPLFPTAARAAGGGGLAVGGTAPAFETTDLDGNPVSLRDLQARFRLVVVNFWGIRCLSCLDEMPYLAELSGRLGPKGLKVVGVNVDGLDGKKVKELLPKAGVTPSYQLVTDADFRIMDAFGVTVTPFTAVIGKDGKVGYTHTGFNDGEEKEIAENVERLLSTAEAGR